MVSAVTMSLLQIFDIRKFMFLLNAYTHQDTMLNQRAIAGTALTCYYYEKRILQYPEAVSRINEPNENTEFIKTCIISRFNYCNLPRNPKDRQENA